MDWKLVGKTDATLDLWSLIHFGFYAFLVSTIAAMTDWRLSVHIVYSLILTMGWEIFEGYAEKKWPAQWSGKIEHWSNRWIGDPISNLSGATFGWFVVSYYRNMFLF